MLQRVLLIIAVALVVFLPQAARASLDITSVNSPVTIDFDNTLAGVNNGAFDGSGFVPITPATGQLDSDAWAVTGVSDGSLAFGGTQTTGDFARGVSAGGVTTGGIYSFDRDNTATVNRALGIQPTVSPGDFTPGTITLQVKNTTGQTISAWDIAYDIFFNNNGKRSNSLNFSWSTSDTTGTGDSSLYTAIGALDFTSPGNDDANAWTLAARSTQIAASVANGGSLFLRWTSADAGGSGGGNVYDEIALDNIKVTAVPEPAAYLFGGLVCGVFGLRAGGRRLVGRLLWQKSA